MIVTSSNAKRNNIHFTFQFWSQLLSYTDRVTYFYKPYETVMTVTYYNSDFDVYVLISSVIYSY